MPTKYPDLFAELAAPFQSHEIKSRSQAGRTFQYITARTVQNRLDDVLGPENWSASFTPSENSVICHLTIVLPEGETITKSDVGGHAGMADAGDDDKSGASDSLKRAAVQLGVARYLYRDGTPAFVAERYEFDLPSGHHDAQYGRGGSAPRQPDRAPQQGQQRDQGPQGQQRQPQGHGGGQGGNDRVPRTGRALFAWTKEMEQRYEVGLLKYLNGWAKLQEMPARMVDFDEEQVAVAYAEAIRKLREVADSRANQEEALAN